MTQNPPDWGQQGGYPPQGPGGYPPQQPSPGYPPQQPSPGYPPQQPGGYPPQQPPQQGYPPRAATARSERTALPADILLSRQILGRRDQVQAAQALRVRQPRKAR